MNSLDKLVPKSWRGWMVALVGLVITFWLYYGCAYEPILQQYQDVFLQKPAQVESIPGFENVSMTIFRPTTIAFSNFVERKMIARMENRGNMDETFTLSAIPQKGSEFLRIRSEANLERDEYSSAFSVTIPRQSIREIELYLSVEHVEDSAQNKNFKMDLYVNGSLVSFGASALDFSYDPLQAFRESAIRFLLFPPFSNLFLASLVFFVVGGVEERKKSLLFSLLCQNARKVVSKLRIPAFSRADWEQFYQDAADIAAWLIASGLLFLALSVLSAGLFFPGVTVLWFVPLWCLGLLFLSFILWLLLLSVKVPALVQP
ncbi:MAG: hypothetical protein OHK0031_01010 [Anaerolineales bacterium]